MSSKPHNSTPAPPTRNVREFETQWLADALRQKWLTTKLSRASWVRRLGIWSENGESHISYLLNGRRGMTFHKAVRIATAAGIDLAQLQTIVRERMKKAQEQKCLSSFITLKQEKQ